MLISIHAPPRGATQRISQSSPSYYFNSRPSARGDNIRGFSAHDIEFQFTPLREGRREFLVQHYIRITYFNSRPSARGDNCARKHLRNCVHISIHAPPRGATRRTAYKFTCFKFQFTPLREGRQKKSAQVHAIGNFNSRPSARGDMEVIRLSVMLAFQFTPLREGRRQKICNFCKSFVQPLQISMA